MSITYDRQISIIRATLSKGAERGNPTSVWNVLKTIRARRFEKSGGVQVEDERDVYTSRVWYSTRFFTDITFKDRIRDDGNDYRIMFIEQVGRKQYLKIHVELAKS